MKHLMSFITMGIIVLLTGASSVMHGQCPQIDYQDPCPNVQWTTTTQLVVLSTGCVVQVSYKVRDCDGTCEVLLDNITALYTFDGCQPCDPWLSGTTIQQITDEVLRYILSRNRGTVPCSPFKAMQPVRIFKAKCWHHALVAGRRVFTPCGGCCIINTFVDTAGGVSTVRLPLPGAVATTPCLPPGACPLELDCNVGPWLYGLPTP